jgi:hypothetical protein
MVAFKRNRKYFSELKMEREGYWVNLHPLFIKGNEGLYPVFKTGGPTGVFPKNHQELILKNLGEDNARRTKKSFPNL